jgi:hypothetical protein
MYDWSAIWALLGGWVPHSSSVSSETGTTRSPASISAASSVRCDPPSSYDDGERAKSLDVHDDLPRARAHERQVGVDAVTAAEGARFATCLSLLSEAYSSPPAEVDTHII